jgi:choline dehydrogenase-like flavoprotein
VLIDAVGVPDGTVVPADVCVIGAGPAGISLALRLAESGNGSIALIESGGFEFDPSVQALARGQVVGLPYFPLHETRLRMVGGSSQSWGGICTPLDPIAFEERSRVGEAAWPFPIGTLDPYLDGALDRCGIDVSRREANERSHRRRLAHWPLDPAVVTPILVHFSRPRRFGSFFREALSASSRISLHLNATATELVLEPGRSAIREVAVKTPGGSGYRVRSRFVVLAAGGVENARLLLASNREMPGGVANGNGAVGRGFMEHPRVVVRFAVRPGSTLLGTLVAGGTAGTLRFLRIGLAVEAQRREDLLAWHANLQCGFAGQDDDVWPAVRRIGIALRPPWNESPYFQDGGGGRTRLRSADVGAVLRRPHRAALGGLAAVRGVDRLRRRLELTAATEQIPDPDNRIELTTERDRLGVQRIRLSWRVGEAEERTHRRALQMLLEQLDRIEPGISSRALDPRDPWPSAIVGTWHHVGATPMSADPSRGVVDADLRCHETENLFITGSSVFPTGGSTAPTVTIVQLSHRLADHLAALIARPPASVSGR